MKPKKLSLTGFPTIDRTIKAENKIISDYDEWLKSEVIQKVEEALEDLYGKEDDDEFPKKGEIYNQGISDSIDKTKAILSALTKESEV